MVQTKKRLKAQIEAVRRIFKFLVYHETLVPISCFLTFLIFIQSYIFNFLHLFLNVFFFIVIIVYILRISIELIDARSLHSLAISD